MTTNLSVSRVLEGVSKNAGSILAIDSPDHRRRENAGEITNDLMPAQSVRTSSRKVFMNSIVSTASQAAATKIVAPSIVKAETAADGADPIFAVIEHERALNDAFLARSRYEDDLEEQGVDLASQTPEMEAIVDASVAARRALANTAPTTLQGLAAFLDYVIVEGENLSSENSQVFFFDGEEETIDLVRSLARCVHGLCTGMSSAA